MAVIEPCDWAARAKDKQGQTFELKPSQGKSSAKAVLQNVQSFDVGGGYTAYTFSFEGKGGPDSDDIYTVSGGGCGDTEIFLVVSAFEGVVHYVANIVCRA